MGSKLQRQNQHIRRLTSKIKRHKKRGWSTEKMEKELSYCTGDSDRPSFNTGAIADARNKRRSSSNKNEQ